ncbi:MAG: TlpA family protein disulfide reductase [Bacteroidota bacterium]
MKIWRTLRPWIVVFGIWGILKYTGLLSSISGAAGSALMKSGLMDYTPDADASTKRSFNYNFKIQDLEGNTVDFNQFRGKVIFLNLWATWCGPCRAEMPSIQALYKRVDHDSIAFVMLSLDDSQNTNKVMKYVNDKAFSFPVYMRSGGLPSQLQVSSIPTTFVIDEDGKIVSKKVGAANYDNDEFQKFLEDLAIR